MKTVIATPVKDDEAVLPSFLESCMKLNPQPSLYIFAENNSCDNTLSLISDFPRPKKIIRLWLRPDTNQILGSKYAPIAIVRDILLSMARRLDVDYLIFLDSDIIPDPLLISKFLVHFEMRKDVDIIGAPYWRFRTFKKLGQTKFEYALALNAILSIENEGKPSQRAQMIFSTNGKPHYTFLWTLRKVARIDVGCVCLSKKVIQDRRLIFYPLLKEHELTNIEEASEDVSFSIRAKRLGYSLHLDGTIKLNHLYWLWKHKKRPWIIRSESSACMLEKANKKRKCIENFY